MKIIAAIQAALTALLLASTLIAQEPFEFRSAEQETRFQELTLELRCAVCGREVDEVTRHHLVPRTRHGADEPQRGKDPTAWEALADPIDAPGPPCTAADLPTQWLSETGCFTAELAPAKGLVPYTVRAPLWSDRAEKTRFVAIPEGAQFTVDDVGRLGLHGRA